MKQKIEKIKEKKQFGKQNSIQFSIFIYYYTTAGKIIVYLAVS